MKNLRENLNNLNAFNQFKADLEKDLEHCEPGSMDEHATEAELSNIQEDIDMTLDHLKIQLT